MLSRYALILNPSNVSNVQKFLLHGTRIVSAAAIPDKEAYIDGGQKKNIEIVEKAAKDYAQHVTKVNENWEKMTDTYYGPDRDMTNFPPIKMSEYHPKVRMGLIPDSWFQALYDKTGVTGPYLFLFGGITFLIQKELWVVDHEFLEVIPFAMAVAFVIKRFGPKVNKAMDARTERFNYLRNVMSIEKIRNDATAVVKHCEKELSQADGVKHVFDAKRESIDHQLEGIYRQRLVDIHRAVKNRLDYHVEKESVRKSFQQKHMVNWVVDSVVKGITPQQEKDALMQSIQHLKTLATKA